MSQVNLLDAQRQLTRVLAGAASGEVEDIVARVDRLAELVGQLHEVLPPAVDDALAQSSMHDAALHALYQGNIHWLRRGHYQAGVVAHNNIVIIARKPRGLPAELQVERLSDWLADIRRTCTGNSATATILRELAQQVENHVVRSGNLYQRLVANGDGDLPMVL